ncbi:MAG: FAD-dependent monooxygenase [Alphaproteobacteria bacterium]|nr:FAD-dependent monooxygenase [Alphaproteobacteria bacterium]
MKTYDVAIIGGGPAGSMLAKFIEPKGYKVALIDVRRLDEAYDGKGAIKSCGGMLAPDAQKLLKKYKIELPSELIDEVQPSFVKTIDVCAKLCRNYKRNYINVDREAFDRLLLKWVKADTYFGIRVSEIRKEDGFFVINNQFRAKFLVGADGATSKVRRTFFPEMKIRTYASIQDVLPEQTSQGYECFFDEKISDYYGWSLLKGGQTLVGFAIPEGRDAVQKFEAFKKANGFGKEIARQGTLILRPSFGHKIYAKENLFLIGEAGGYISPSSAEGISYAIKTAKILAESNFSLRRFKCKMLIIRLNLMYKNVKSFFMYCPLIRKWIMKASIFN